ncbi:MULTISPECIES: hypothetical protein [Terrabacteria group]|uniref:hypothetical protein n=1 Tax=Bacillati TaxID=1783272 RepID=UPI001C6F31DC|nr:MULTISPECIES: hypothetical protein [Terrabacteria group]MBW9212869.1 hypothetical protein [Trueperella sp. zg.1013]
MRIYNLNTQDENKRFFLSILVGLPASILFGYLFYLVSKWFAFRLDIFYVVIAYTIALLLKKVGRGVTKKFSILGAVLMLITILVGDALLLYGNYALHILTSLTLLSRFIRLEVFSLTANLNALIGLLIRVSTIYEAYYYSVLF